MFPECNCFTNLESKLIDFDFSVPIHNEEASADDMIEIMEQLVAFYMKVWTI